MGVIPKVYPSYREILNSQLGSESFNSMVASEEKEETVANVPTEHVDAQANNAASGGSDGRKDTDRLPEKKRKRKKKPAKKAQVCSDEGEGHGTEAVREEDEQSTKRQQSEREEVQEEIPADPIKDDPTKIPETKRARSVDSNPSSPVGMRQKASDARSIVSTGNNEEPMTSLPVSRRLSWGGLDPPH